MGHLLSEVVDQLKKIAPLEHAASWDRVGLLVEPSRSGPVERAMMTIDLTPSVLDEAIRSKCQLVVAYHPPLFTPLERLSIQGTIAEQLAVRAIESSIAIYSPHTALDVAVGGVNDWLADGVGEGSRRAIEPLTQSVPGQTHKLVVYVPSESVEKMCNALAEIGVGGIGQYTHCSYRMEGVGTFFGHEQANPTVGEKGRLEQVNETRLEMVCDQTMMGDIQQVLAEVHPYEEPAWEMLAIEAIPSEAMGQGRLVTLNEPTSLEILIDRLKHYLEIKTLRIAHGAERPIQTIALCAGAGGSVLEGCQADFYLTGEMRHHDVLAAVNAGTSVVLTEHTNSERGYLSVLKKTLMTALPEAEWLVSQTDHDPLQTV